MNLNRRHYKTDIKDITMKQKRKNQKQMDHIDAAVESIACWSLPKEIKNRLYRNGISDIYELVVCTEQDLSDMGFNILEISFICHALQSYGMELCTETRE